MITVLKEDLENVVYRIMIPAHYGTIFHELIEVYDPGVAMLLDDMLRPFVNKVFKYKIPGPLAYRKDVRYADYLIPLFYTAYVCKNERSSNIIRDVLGLILKDWKHFVVPEGVTVWGLEKEEYDDHRKLYWGCDSLSNVERDRIGVLYNQYSRLKQVGGKKSST